MINLWVDKFVKFLVEKSLQFQILEIKSLLNKNKTKKIRFRTENTFKKKYVSEHNLATFDGRGGMRGGGGGGGCAEACMCFCMSLSMENL